MTRFAMRLTDRPVARFGWIGGITAASLPVIVLLSPQVDYLPVAQTDMIWNNFRLPPGGNIETARAEMAPVVMERLQPYLEGKKQPKGKYYNSIRLDFQGADLGALMDAARVAVDEIPQAFPGLELNQPELQLVPDEWRIARAGLTRPEVASAIRAYTGGIHRRNSPSCRSSRRAPACRRSAN